MKKINKLKLIILFLKGLTGSIGAALILDGKHPYITILVIGIGAGTIEVINAMKETNNDETIS